MSTKYFCDGCGAEVAEYTVNQPGRTRQLSVSIGGKAMYGQLAIQNKDYMIVLCRGCERKEKAGLIASLSEEAFNRLDEAAALLAREEK